MIYDKITYLPKTYNRLMKKKLIFFFFYNKIILFIETVLIFCFVFVFLFNVNLHKLEHGMKRSLTPVEYHQQAFEKNLNQSPLQEFSPSPSSKTNQNNNNNLDLELNFHQQQQNKYFENQCNNIDNINNTISDNKIYQNFKDYFQLPFQYHNPFYLDLTTEQLESNIQQIQERLQINLLQQAHIIKLQKLKIRKSKKFNNRQKQQQQQNRIKNISNRNNNKSLPLIEVPLKQFKISSIKTDQDFESESEYGENIDETSLIRKNFENKIDNDIYDVNENHCHKDISNEENCENDEKNLINSTRIDKLSVEILKDKQYSSISEENANENQSLLNLPLKTNIDESYDDDTTEFQLNDVEFTSSDSIYYRNQQQKQSPQMNNELPIPHFDVHSSREDRSTKHYTISNIASSKRRKRLSNSSRSNHSILNRKRNSSSSNSIGNHFKEEYNLSTMQLQHQLSIQQQELLQQLQLVQRQYLMHQGISLQQPALAAAQQGEF